MRHFFKIVILLVAIIAIIFFIREAGFIKIAEVAGSIDFRFSFLALITYFLINAARAFRFSSILGGKISAAKFFPIVFLQNFFNVILPFRIGEASYIYLVNKTGGVSLGNNIASLLGARILDFLSALIILSASLTFVVRNFSESATLFFISLTALILIFIVFAVLIFCAERIGGFFGRLGEERADSIFMKIKEGVEAFSVFRKKDILFKTIFLSFLIWGMTFLFGFFLLRSVGLALGFWQFVFAYSLPVLITMVPIPVPGGLGSYDVSLVSGLLVVGVSYDAAIVSTLALHAQELLAVFILAAAGYFWRRIQSHEK